MNRRSFLTAATAAAAVTGAAPFTATAAPARRTDSERRLLREWFTSTYRSMAAMTTELGLAADKIDVSGGGTPVPSAQTSPTNIGCGLWSTVAAAGLGVISDATMHRSLTRAVTAVERLERAHGFWFNWYDPHDGSVLTTWPESGDPVRPFLSTVDNAWLVTGLRIAAHADPALRHRIGALLDGADWSYFYTPTTPPTRSLDQVSSGAASGRTSPARANPQATTTAPSTPSHEWPVTSESPTDRCPPSTTGT